MIQDIAPKKFDNHFDSTQVDHAKNTDIVFIFENRTILCRNDEQLSFPRVKDVIESGSTDKKKLTYLFSVDDCHYYLSRREELSEGLWENLQNQGFSFQPTSILRNANPKEDCFAAETAYHLYVWYRDNQFCGRCGHPTIFSEKERALVCPDCGNIIYPKINPAVIVGVIKGDSILMTRYAGREYKGHALIAGFCEIGETVEETVQREVREEVGLHVTNIRYYKSQPWGFDSDILMGYFCDAVEGEEIRMDSEELSRARFISRDEIGDEGELSLTAEMIMRFKAGDV